MRVLPNTVDERFAPGPALPALRERLKLAAGPILLTVGRLAASERYKGHELIFAALATATIVRGWRRGLPSLPAM